MAKQGGEAALLAWLDGGGRVDATFTREGVSGLTLLMGAAGHGQERVVKLLLRRGAEINLQSNGGGTALMLATGWDHPAVVRRLLRAGCRCGAYL